MPSFEIILAATPLEVEQVMDLRRSVLCGELHWPRELALDGRDAESLLLLASAGPKPVGTARLRCEGDWGHIELLAVLERARGRGLGLALLKELEARAAEQGISRLSCLAPDASAAFFKKAAWTEKGRQDGWIAFEK